MSAVQATIASSTEFEDEQERKISILVKRNPKGLIVLTFYNGAMKEGEVFQDIELTEDVAKNLGRMLVNVASK